MIIRKMTINDYEEVYSLWMSTPGLGLNNIDDSREGIDRYLKRNPNTSFIAVKDNKIVGIIISGHDGRRGFIYHTTVAENEQRHGIGKQLLSHAMDALEKEGIHKVALVVFERNKKGNDFWEKEDFISRNDLVYRNKAISELQRIDT